jgi:dolichyl-phosphate-mannose--protein O-mannosyl transferase
MECKKNLTTSGRILRALFALILFFVSYKTESKLALIAGLFTLFEAAASWCVVFQFFPSLNKKNSCNKCNKK